MVHTLSEGAVGNGEDYGKLEAVLSPEEELRFSFSQVLPCKNAGPVSADLSSSFFRRTCVSQYL